MTASHEPEPDVPTWMQAVDREAFYNADPSSSPEEDAASPAGPPPDAPSNGSPVTLGGCALTSSRGVDGFLPVHRPSVRAVESGAEFADRYYPGDSDAFHNRYRLCV